MKKILCLIDSLGAGGAQRQLVGLASFLKRRGYDVIVAFYHDNRFYVDLLHQNGVPYVYLEKASNNQYRIWQVANYIRKTKPQVVISYLETPSICTCIAKIFIRSFKLIVSERNTTQHKGRNEIIRFNLFRWADYVVPNAFSQADFINNHFPSLTDKVVTIPNFVDLKQFKPPIKRVRKVIPEIMIAASIWPSKNTLGFIDAAATLRNKGRRFHVSWFGKDTLNIDYYKECERKIEENNLASIISLLEKTNNIAECYCDADYFCLPSFYEGTSNVICEAMASGLPVMCSDVCDNSRYVEDGVNGFLFNPREVDSMISAIEKMLDLSGEEYDELCINSRSKAEKQLSQDGFIAQYIKLIEE